MIVVSDPVPSIIRIRSGRHSKDVRVLLAQPAHLYKTGEKLTIDLADRSIKVIVEIPISETNDILYVA